LQNKAQTNFLKNEERCFRELRTRGKRNIYTQIQYILVILRIIAILKK